MPPSTLAQDIRYERNSSNRRCDRCSMHDSTAIGGARVAATDARQVLGVFCAHDSKSFAENGLQHEWAQGRRGRKIADLAAPASSGAEWAGFGEGIQCAAAFLHDLGR
jgi:hypothetical protein